MQSEFDLEIITPEKVAVKSRVSKLIIRTIDGDVGILKDHANYISAIDKGPATVFFSDGRKERAELENGFVSVVDGKVIVMVLRYQKKFD